MIRHSLTLCCFGLLGGLLFSLCPEESAVNDLVGKVLSAQPASPSTSRFCFDCPHTLPLIADAEESDDGEELSERDGDAGIPLADYLLAADSSRCTTYFGGAVQPRLSNTLNSLGVRLQI